VLRGKPQMQNCPNSGKPCFMAIPSQAPMGRPREAVLDGEGVETRRAAPTLQRGLPARPEHGEGIVQTTNPPAWGEAAKAVAGKKIRRAAMPVGVRVPPPAPLPVCSAWAVKKSRAALVEKADYLDGSFQVVRNRIPMLVGGRWPHPMAWSFAVMRGRQGALRSRNGIRERSVVGGTKGSGLLNEQSPHCRCGG